MISDSKKAKQSSQLSIRLTESAVFLPTDSIPTRRGSTLPDPRNAVLRGLLILELVKPTKITSIDVELTAVTSTAWPEGTQQVLHSLVHNFEFHLYLRLP
jgi:hypothetical protein